MAYAISKVATYQEQPQQSHWAALKRTYRYLKSTLQFGILYSSSISNPRLVDYRDSDSVLDFDDRKSRTSYVYILGDSAIAWASQKQALITDSTTTAELIAISETVKDITWLTRLLDSLSIQSPLAITVYRDNQVANQLIKNVDYHRHTKHIDVKFLFIREF